MDLNHLKTFYILAQVKNYSNCAKRMFVTQSAVSHSIKKLENSIGHKLIDKSKSEFNLTQEGKTLFLTCQKVFAELENAEEKLSKKEISYETISLGSPVEFGVSILIKEMNTFLQQNPEIHVDFKLGNYLFQELAEGQLDILIDCKEHQDASIKTIPLFQEEYAVVASPDYIEENVIEKVSDLENCNIISLDKNLTWWNNFFHALPTEWNPVFSRVTQIDHVRGIINAVLNSIGVGFVPKYTILNELQDRSLIALFPEINLLEDKFRIYIKHNNADADKFKSLIQFIKKIKLT